MTAGRDAARSRAAILEAAETLFARRGFDGTSLSDVGAGAGLSRGAPSYFFGSKEDLYRAVLERVFADRQEATAAAVAPLHVWAESDATAAELRPALARAVGGYMEFVLGRPAFARFIAREELDGAHRLRAVDRESEALERAFGAVRAVARRRGLASFRVRDAVLLFVSLAYAPLVHENTLLAALERDLRDPAVRRRHVSLAADQLMALLRGTPES
ncbi:MAG: TetR/AcrR family transcriptional regulator [Solirubrobacteraceae bacterium]|nr:TetR/AcrR family transcriptional regulator [Solirubrobacteraceae bacterium]